MEIPSYIETERLYLRPYRPGDGSILYAAGLRNREHLAEFESGNLLMLLKNENQTEEIIGGLIADGQRASASSSAYLRNPATNGLGRCM